MGAAGGILSGAAALIGATKKSSSPSSYAAAAPTQTEDQKEMSAFIKPYMKDWMTNPPKVSAPQYTPTRINYGGSGGGTFGSGGANQQPSNGGFSYSSGSWAANPANAEASAKMNDIGSQLSDLRQKAAGYDLTSLQSQRNSLANTGAIPFGARHLGGGSYYVNTQAGDYTWRPQAVNTKAIADIDAKIAEANQINAKIKELEGQQGQVQASMGPEQVYQAGEMNISAVPVGKQLEGQFGSFVRNDNWYDPISRLTQNPYGTYNAVDNSGLIDAASQALTDQTGRINSIGAPITQRNALDYNNALEGTVQNRLTSNMDRKLQEGYDASYLKELAAQGIDPLNDAYKEAVRTAGADFNRLGLGGSGFELGNKYGSQADSITSKYLAAVGDVQRSVALRGAEAARADRFANANMQDQALGQLGNLSQQQNANQFNRLNADVSRELQNKDLTKQALSLTRQQDLDRNSLAQQELSNRLAEQQMNEQNRQYWDQSGRSALSQQIGLGQANDQQNEQNRQFWSQQNQSQREYDNAQAMQNWQANLGVMQWLANRDDEAQKMNIQQQLGLDTQNIGYQQDALTNIMNFINGQNASAGMANSNYWQGINQANASNLQSQNNIANAVAGISGMFTPKQTTVATQPSTSWTSYLTNPMQGLSALGGLFK